MSTLFPADLSSREMLALQLLMQSYSAAEIAEELDISEVHARESVAGILEKLVRAERAAHARRLAERYQEIAENAVYRH